MTPPPRTALLLLATILAACSSSPALQTSKGPAPGEPTLGEVRAATEHLRDVNTALAEGYIRDPFDLCDTAEMMGKPAKLGAMGVHYFRPDLMGISEPPNPRVNGDGVHTNFLEPAILIYEPQEDGSLELVAVENLVFIKAWEATGATAPPSFHGVPWDRMADDPATAVDEAHMFEPHFDRHVWLYRNNPNGAFTPFNPAVSCKYHAGAMKHPMPQTAEAAESASLAVAGVAPSPVRDATARRHSH